MADFWMIRAGRKSVHVGSFLSKNVVAINWGRIGRIEIGTSNKDIARRFKAAYPSKMVAQLRIAVNQLDRFHNEMSVGDKVFTYDGGVRLYYVGEVSSGPEWAPNIIADLPHVRHVKWSASSSRDSLDSKVLASLGAIYTLLKLTDKVVANILEHAKALPESDAQH